MLRLLIAKDFRRTFRNPWPWLLNLALPLAMTGLIGLAFGSRGGGNDSANLARIKLAVVDEDQSILGSLLRSALTQSQAVERIEPIFVSRNEGLRILRENKIAAVLIVPTNFTSRYFAGESGLKLEVIKNPAQQFMPTIVEELAAIGVTGLNAISRNFNSEFPRLRSFTTNGWDIEEWATPAFHIGSRIKDARAYISPPLVSYQKAVTTKKSDAKSVVFSVFGYILPGMASAFLLFIADQSMRDFHREVRMKTLDRQRATGCGAGLFIAGKILFTALSVMLAATILFTAGSLTFGIDWGKPGLLALACAGYSLFAAGLLAMLSALAPTERRADALNSMLIFGIAFAGGSYLPSDNFPRFMQEHVCPLMPNYWLIEAARSLQRPGADLLPPMIAVAKLTVIGIVLGAIAAFAIERRLTSGSRA
jgi:ABC-type multidrug transport system permease subunit